MEKISEEDYKKIIELSNKCHKKTLEQKKSWIMLNNLSKFKIQKWQNIIDSLDSTK